MLIPWNFKTIDISILGILKKEWNDILNELGITKSKNLSPAEVWNKLKQDKINKLKKVIANISDINEYSMCLYSGLYNETEKIGALYTGDYNAKGEYFDQLYNAYKKVVSVWDTISLVQVPHHGSEKNYNSKLVINPYFTKMIVSDDSPSKLQSKNKTLMQINNEGGKLYVTGASHRFITYQYLFFYSASSFYRFMYRNIPFFYRNLFNNCLTCNDYYRFYQINVGNEYN